MAATPTRCELSHPDRFCAECGYNLRGLADNRCPECGLPFDRAAPPAPRVPWVRRAELGTLRAYWRTVMLVTLHPVRFAAEFAPPAGLSLEDARDFRRMTMRHGMAGAGMVGLSWAGRIVSDEQRVAGWVAAAAVLATFLVAARFLLWLLTEETVVKPVPMTRTRRAPLRSVLNLYATAALAWAPLVALPALALPWTANLTFSPAPAHPLAGALSTGFLLALGMQAAVLWVDELALLRAADPPGPLETAALALWVPIRWVLVSLVASIAFAGMSLVLVPVALGLWTVVRMFVLGP